MTKEGCCCVCLSVILITSKNYYSQILLECKYILKEKKISTYINYDLEFFFLMN